MNSAEVIALLNSDSDGEDSPPFSIEPSDGADWQHPEGARGSPLQATELESDASDGDGALNEEQEVINAAASSTAVKPKVSCADAPSPLLSGRHDTICGDDNWEANALAPEPGGRNHTDENSLTDTVSRESLANAMDVACPSGSGDVSTSSKMTSDGAPDVVNDDVDAVKVMPPESKVEHEVVEIRDGESDEQWEKNDKIRTGAVGSKLLRRSSVQNEESAQPLELCYGGRSVAAQISTRSEDFALHEAPTRKDSAGGTSDTRENIQGGFKRLESHPVSNIPGQREVDNILEAEMAYAADKVAARVVQNQSEAIIMKGARLNISQKVAEAHEGLKAGSEDLLASREGVQGAHTFDPEKVVTTQRSSVDSFVDALPDGFMRCPGCPMVYELVPNEDAARGGGGGLSAAHNLPKGANLSRRAAMRHSGRHRFRCPACGTSFCDICRSIPYHMGFDCGGWVAHQAKPKCVYCGDVAEVPGSEGKSTDILDQEGPEAQPCCRRAECVERANEGCWKKLSCGHRCRGVGAGDCLPCIEPECPSAVINGDAEFCNICWTETLVAAPCVQLDCGHLVHASCGREQLKKGRPTARLTFGFMSCPVCRADKALAKHPILTKTAGISEQLALAHEVEELALQRLRADELPPLKRSPMDALQAKIQRRVAGFARHRRSDANHVNWRRGGIVQNAHMRRYSSPRYMAQQLSPRNSDHLAHFPPGSPAARAVGAVAGGLQRVSGSGIEWGMPMVHLSPPLNPQEGWSVNSGLQEGFVKRKREIFIAQADVPMARLAAGAGAGRGSPRETPESSHVADVNATIASRSSAQRERVEKAGSMVDTMHGPRREATRNSEVSGAEVNFLLPGRFPHRSRRSRDPSGLPPRDAASRSNLQLADRHVGGKHYLSSVGVLPIGAHDVPLGASYIENPFRQELSRRADHDQNIGHGDIPSRCEMRGPSDGEPEGIEKHGNRVDSKEGMRRDWVWGASSWWGAKGGGGSVEDDAKCGHKRRFRALLAASDHYASRRTVKVDSEARGEVKDHDAFIDVGERGGGEQGSIQKVAVSNGAACDAADGSDVDGVDGSAEEANPQTDGLPWQLQHMESKASDGKGGKENRGASVEKTSVEDAFEEDDIVVLGVGSQPHFPSAQSQTQSTTIGGVDLGVSDKIRLVQRKMDTGHLNSPTGVATVSNGSFFDDLNDLSDRQRGAVKNSRGGGTPNVPNSPESRLDGESVRSDARGPANPLLQATGMEISNQISTWPILGIRAAVAAPLVGAKVGVEDKSGEGGVKLDTRGRDSPGKIGLGSQGINIRDERPRKGFSLMVDGAPQVHTYAGKAVGSLQTDPVATDENVEDIKTPSALLSSSSLSKEERVEMVKRALKKYSFYQCHSCRKPFFGGLVSCEPSNALGTQASGVDMEGAGDEAAAAERALTDVQSQELLCGRCSAGSGGADCPEHGQEFMEHKCYWCCRRVASYFCGGVMHFCDICHLHGFAAKPKPCFGGSRCLFGGCHPPNARNGLDEFVLGCGICRPKPEEDSHGAAQTRSIS